jgi:tetratricopeptide (TPR) repeat protein
MDNLEALIEAGLRLEREGKEQEAIEHFRALVERYPDNARVQFEYAGAHDFAGYEAQAIPIYRKAIQLGLADDVLPRAYVQLGSSLRNIGQSDEAIQVLGEGLARFPDLSPLRIFRAFALYSSGLCKEAVVELLEVLLAHPATLGGYRRAVRYYTDEIKSVKN